MASDHILAIDQGTTSTRAILFDAIARPVAIAERALPQHYPQSGWVEHDAEDIWRGVVDTAREAVAASGLPAGRIATIAITNQRETVVLWDRATGEPLCRAIVWQDRRTADACAALKADGAEPLVQARTGLLLDPYFSATKIQWMLDHVPGARERAERGELAAGTIDSFLLWRLTGGAVHASDLTNASRTLLYDIHAQCWDDELCRLFGVPRQILPEVFGNSRLFGTSTPDFLGAAIPICGIAGDQQAALVGQRCFAPGMAKSTYGTGCFMLLNTGEQAVASQHRLLTTPAYCLDGKVHYALEGSIFVAGAAVGWLRDGLRLIEEPAQTAQLAASVSDDHGVTLVPAFVGLGAPHWRPDARAAIFGLTLDTSPAHLARAALEAVAFQTRDLAGAMAADGAAAPAAMRVDGKMAENDWLCQFLADLLDLPVERPANPESTALGAAYLAGFAAGVWSGPDALSAQEGSARFTPRMGSAERARLAERWTDALARTLG
jgi:glycerol kinase